MKVEQLSTIVGFILMVVGIGVSNGVQQNKVDTLEAKMSELYSVDEIRGLEKRLTTLEVTQANSDVGHLQSTLATIQGQLNNVEEAIQRHQGQIDNIQSADHGEVESRVSVNQSRIGNLQASISRIQTQIERLATKLDSLNDNPLAM